MVTTLSQLVGLQRVVIPGGAKDVTGVKADDGSYDFVLKGTDPVFADTDTFAQVWLQNWTTEDFTFNAFTLLDKDGNPLLVVESDKEQGGNLLTSANTRSRQRLHLTVKVWLHLTAVR